MGAGGPTAATPVENPDCSCRLTRVRLPRSRRLTGSRCPGSSSRSPVSPDTPRPLFWLLFLPPRPFLLLFLQSTVSGPHTGTCLQPFLQPFLCPAVCAPRCAARRSLISSQLQ